MNCPYCGSGNTRVVRADGIKERLDFWLCGDCEWRWFNRPDYYIGNCVGCM